jgi:hypothetical protein
VQEAALGLFWREGASVFTGRMTAGRGSSTTSFDGKDVDAMILRIWRTQAEPPKAEDYLAFAPAQSLPMLRKQQGFRGVLFVAHDADRPVVTL